MGSNPNQGGPQCGMVVIMFECLVLGHAGFFTMFPIPKTIYFLFIGPKKILGKKDE